MSHIKLDGYYARPTPGGLDIGCINQTVKLLDWTTVELAVPFLPLGNDLAITPTVEPDGDSAVRLDFSRWSPLCYRGEGLGLFPANFRRQHVAVRVARAFDADPATGWDDTYEQKTAWLHAWGADNGVRLG